MIRNESTQRDESTAAASIKNEKTERVGDEHKQRCYVSFRKHLNPNNNLEDKQKIEGKLFAQNLNTLMSFWATEKANYIILRDVKEKQAQNYEDLNPVEENELNAKSQTTFVLQVSLFCFVLIVSPITNISKVWQFYAFSPITYRAKYKFHLEIACQKLEWFSSQVPTIKHLSQDV
uniref:Uncharacterized protein n=1 Tax=Glossina pallidipes TaxID=7398 RepID=A0A1A9ZAN1_GLOPL